MKRPKDWDDVKPYDDIRRLPAGGYICEIKKVEDPYKDKDMIAVRFDVAEGEYKGIFFDEAMARKANNPDFGWPFAGSKWIGYFDRDGNTNRMLKGFVNAVEAENVKIDDGKTLNFDKAVGALVGVVFGEEEQLNSVGSVYVRAVPSFFCTCEDIRTNNYKLPKKKELKRGDSVRRMQELGSADSFTAVDEEVPF